MSYQELSHNVDTNNTVICNKAAKTVMKTTSYCPVCGSPAKRFATTYYCEVCDIDFDENKRIVD